MDRDQPLRGTRGGRTDLVFELLKLPDGRAAVAKRPVSALQWFVYYCAVTALRAVVESGADLGSLDLGQELGNAAFCGHWKMCDYLLARGADANHAHPETGETPLYATLSKAGRPYFSLRVRPTQGPDMADLGWRP